MEKALMKQIDSILSTYFTDDDWLVVKEESGVNNTTRFIKRGQDTYVLRLYDNHQDRAKVLFEHKVLLSLLEQARLPYHVPEPVPALDGSTCAAAPDGRLAVLFRHIPGQRAELDTPAEAEAAGRAVGELINALQVLQVEADSAYEPYYDIWNVHPLVSQERLLAWLEEAAEEGEETRLAASELRAQLAELEAALPALQQLPAQLVHSDVVYGNMLADAEGRITAVLDFEFVTPDLRAMELAVLLSELVPPELAAEPGAVWPQVEAALRGYGQAARLTHAELESLPLLIALRRLVLVIHFLGRSWAQVDERDPREYLMGFAAVRRLLTGHGAGWVERAKQLIEEEEGR